MALIKCSECGKEISDKSKVCVNCGNPIQKTIKYENQKPYDELTTQEKKQVSLERGKNEGFPIIITIIILFMFLMFIFSFTLKLPMILVVGIDVFLALFCYFHTISLDKKYYEKNMMFEDKKEIIDNEIKTSITSIKQENKNKVSSFKKWVLIGLIITMILAITIFLFRNDRILKNWNKALTIYDLIKNISCLLPSILLLLLYFYGNTGNIIFKNIVKYVSIISNIIFLIFVGYWWLVAIPNNNGWTIYNYDTDFILYNFIMTISYFMIIQNIEKKKGVFMYGND